MGKKVHYPSEIKIKAIEMKKNGIKNSEIMKELGIKNVTQIKTWMRWERNGESYRFDQPIGKQYSYSKGPEGQDELEAERKKNKHLQMQINILKKVHRIRKELVPQVVIELVEELSKEYKIIDILGVLEVPKSTFYRWKKKYINREPNKLEMLIINLCEETKHHYGHRKIKALLKQRNNIKVNRKTVQRIMQKFNLQCQIKVKRQKYINGESNIIVENILNRNFKAERPNEKWVTDITYLPYGSSMLYVSTIMDLYNNEIIAYTISSIQDTNFVLSTLKEALNKRRPKHVLLHSDQGSVYTSYAYQNFAKEKGIITSMSRKGNCHDNAVIESFHSSLKSEGFKDHRRSSNTNIKVIEIVNQYMCYYNEKRIQAKLNYLAPIEYGRQVA
ncbi:IS3 family transposase [Cytobacillus praedii]|uniref:IS3 family transposase n=2 Tax=Cytobacillus praedii TaxID=1742358 RepID=UPI003AF7FD1A